MALPVLFITPTMFSPAGRARKGRSALTEALPALCLVARGSRGRLAIGHRLARLIAAEHRLHLGRCLPLVIGRDRRALPDGGRDIFGGIRCCLGNVCHRGYRVHHRLLLARVIAANPRLHLGRCVLLGVGLESDLLVRETGRGATRLLCQHLDHHVARLDGLDGLGCVGVARDGRAIDRDNDVALHQHLVGGGARLDQPDPRVAIVPLVIALNDEALRRKAQSARRRQGCKLGRANAPISCPRSACSGPRPLQWAPSCRLYWSSWTRLPAKVTYNYS
eukprot:scaffold71385_cov54-Phaeocystis_antarctica.AAC.2